MATQTVSSVKLKVDVDYTDATGTAKVRQYTFSGVNPAAAADDLYAVGTALSTLQPNPVHSIVRTEDAVVANA